MLTHKICIKPTPKQEQILWILSEKCRLLYNFALNERRQNWESNRTKPETERNYITYTTQQNNLPALKRQFPEYFWVYSKVLQMTLRKLDADYKSFFARWKTGDKQARPPRFKGKNFFTTLCYNQSGFSIDTERKTIQFSHKHPSGVALLFNLPWLSRLEGEVKQVEIFQDARHRWFVAIVRSAKVSPFVDNMLYQAIDLGITNLVTAVNMHGKFIQIQNRRPDLYWRKKIQEVQSRRDHCKKGSHRWHFYRKKLQKMQQKLANQLRDYQHKVSKNVVENTQANTLVLGALKVKTMARKQQLKGNSLRAQAARTLNYSVYNTGALGRFAEFLTYKAEKVGKRVARIDESYTTKTCCVCGQINDRLLSERVIQCNCGTTLDRDKNAAVNIMVRFLLQQSPVNREPLQAFLHGLHRHTALPHIPRGVDSMGTPGIIQE
ncbi:MAG: RNA-guided endonuclease InsQ/TnpB family protein [Candidatus Hodarchaeota archaeon]